MDDNGPAQHECGQRHHVQPGNAEQGRHGQVVLVLAQVLTDQGVDVLVEEVVWCVSVAPSGRPVVPDVYMIRARSSCSTGSSTSSSEPEARNRSYSSPGPPPSTLTQERAHAGQFGLQARSNLALVLPEDHGGGTAVAQNVFHSRLPQPGVHQDCGRPDRPRGEERLQQGGVVEPHVGHPAPVAHARSAGVVPTELIPADEVSGVQQVVLDDVLLDRSPQGLTEHRAGQVVHGHDPARHLVAGDLVVAVLAQDVLI